MGQFIKGYSAVNSNIFNMLITVDRLDTVLDDLVRSTGIIYKFSVEEKEKKDVDRCFLMLRDMAGYVKEKLSSLGGKGDASTATVEDVAEVDGEHDNFEFVEENDIVDSDIVNAISEEIPVITEDKKRTMKQHSTKREEKRKAKKAKLETKTVMKTFDHTLEESDAATAPTGTNVFKSEWMDPKNLLFDVNGDRLSDYLAPVTDSPSMASCLACRISFSISMQGVGQVYLHARGAGHKTSIARLR